MGVPRTVLLVEDEPEIRAVVAAALRRAGYEVVPAADGDEAEDLLVRDLPDLAVFDMMLPGRSGFQLARLVKERSDGRVPVIMMSGNTSAAHQDYAFAAGADAFIPKPFSLTELTATASRLCPPSRPGSGSWTFPAPAAAGS